MKTKIKELSLPFEEHEVDIKNHVWITAQKKKMPVNQMVTKHIKNCINCWNSNGNMSIPKDYLGGKEKWLKIFSDELSKRN